MLRKLLLLALALAVGLPAQRAHAQDDDEQSDAPPSKHHKKKPSPDDEEDAAPKKSQKSEFDISDLDDSPPPPKKPAPRPPPEDAAPKKAPGPSEDDSAPQRKHLSDDDEDAAPKKQHASDDDEGDAGAAKQADSDEGASSDDAVVVHAGWGAVAGHPPNGRMVFGELGLPGVRGLYLVSKGDNFDYGGGGEIDFPPLSLQGHSPRGFNALRFLGRMDYYVPTDVTQIFVRFEPQWIATLGSASVGGFFYLPVEAGAGFDAGPVHLAASVGMGLQFAGSPWFPFTDSLIFSSPFIGLGGELPVSDSLALTARVRLQTYAWDSPGPDKSPTLIGLGFLAVGAAYRY